MDVMLIAKPEGMKDEEFVKYHRLLCMNCKTPENEDDTCSIKKFKECVENLRKGMVEEEKKIAELEEMMKNLKKAKEENGVCMDLDPIGETFCYKIPKGIEINPIEDKEFINKYFSKECTICLIHQLNEKITMLELTVEEMKEKIYSKE